MKVAIYGRRFNSSFNGSILSIFDVLKKHNVKYIIYKPFASFIKDKVHYEPASKDMLFQTGDEIGDVDMVLSIGGDGTFLETVTLVRDSGIPILGINSGRLGFLANISKDAISLALDQVLNGEFELEQRSLIEIDTNKDDFGENNFALNGLLVRFCIIF
jgi:NAD+ kinase